MSAQKEVWCLIDSSGIGGIESHVIELSSALNSINISVRVVLLKSYGHHPLIDILESKCIPYSIAHNIRGLLNLTSAFTPAIFHTHGYKAGIIGRIIGKLLRIKVVSTFHAGERPQGKLAIYDWLDRQLAGVADHVYAVSQAVANGINTQCEVIENFVDIQDIKPSLGHSVAFVGRLSHEKGPDIFTDIASNYLNTDFHIYGSGPMEIQLEKNCSHNVIFHGEAKCMNDVWQDIGLLLICSRYEGLPMAAIEAMARGIPVIAFNIGHLHKLITHKKNGWLVEPGDINQFQASLNQWLGLSLFERKIMRRLAIEKIQKNFSKDAVLPKYLARYRSLDQDILPQKSTVENEAQVHA